MIRAVIFDMDGILLDTEKIYCHFWMEAGCEAGYDWKMVHSLMLRSMAPEFAEPMMKEIFGQDFDYHGVRNRRKALMNAYMETHPVEIKPGAEELLRYLKSHYFKTAVALTRLSAPPWCLMANRCRMCTGTPASASVRNRKPASHWRIRPMD